MNRHSRTSLRARLQVESVEDRIAPAHLGVTAAAHVVVAAHHAIHHRLAAHDRAAELRASTVQVRSAATRVESPVVSLRAQALSAHHRAVAHGTSALATATHRAVTTTSVSASAVRIITMPVITIPTSVPPTSSNPAPNLPEPSLPPNVDGNLNTIYQQYEAFESNGGTGTFSTPLASFIRVQGTDVGIEVHGNGSGDFGSLVSALENLGMQVQTVDGTTGNVYGMLPIAQLPSVAGNSLVFSVMPEYLPMLSMLS
jgi:hypothetical protein